MSFIPIENIGGENARKWLPTILPALQKLFMWRNGGTIHW